MVFRSAFARVSTLFSADITQTTAFLTALLLRLPVRRATVIAAKGIRPVLLECWLTLLWRGRFDTLTYRIPLRL